ncbi:winged helix-turn-helix transcriptional regulator [Avibacterium avium]|uniref:HTH-type transcriptional regulator n=1 Tax=Avibacterium avium TaxID=751 RepID=A0A379ATI1_AVIAV|nr:helix-turn-helix domain-containing protein [Avibacterium avium]SUB24621.1 HTH-type transcriptional regulator [Avibacterium avium]
MKEKEKKLPDCEVEITLMMMSERWRVLIIRELLSGTKRFGELKKTLTGISQKVLTANLRAMETQGLLTRKVYAEVPPRVEYTLTEDGKSLKSVLTAMAAWGENYRQKYQEK